MRKPTPKMIEALVYLFGHNGGAAHIVAPRSTVAGMFERGLISSAGDDGARLTAAGLAFLVDTRRAVVAADGSFICANREPLTADQVTAALIRFEDGRALEAETLAKADAIRAERGEEPEFPTGLKLRNPATGTTFEVIEHTYAVKLRNLRTDTVSAVPQDMARELDRVAEAEESDRVHEDANLAWANNIRAEVRDQEERAVAALPIGAPVRRRLDGDRGHVVAHHGVTVEVQPVDPRAGTLAGTPSAFELDTDPTALWLGEPETYLTDDAAAWDLAWSMWNALALMAGSDPRGSFYRAASADPDHPARPALDTLESMGFVHAWNDGTGYAITPAGEMADRHPNPVVVGSTVVNVLDDGSTVVDVVDDEERPARTLPELVTKFDAAMAKTVSALMSEGHGVVVSSGASGPTLVSMPNRDTEFALSKYFAPSAAWERTSVSGFLPALNAALTADEGALLDSVDTTAVSEGDWLAGASFPGMGTLTALESRGLAYRGAAPGYRGVYYVTAIGAALVKYRRAIAVAKAAATQPIAGAPTLSDRITEINDAQHAEYNAQPPMVRAAIDVRANMREGTGIGVTPGGIRNAGNTADAHLNVRETLNRLRRGLTLTSGDRTALADLLDTVSRSEASYGHSTAFGAWYDVSNTYRAHFGDNR